MKLLRLLGASPRSHRRACSSAASGSSSRIPLGLAAGFDKNGDYLDALGAIGFSHVELGTVTPRPQPGNPKPRMFRVPGATALVNRMGFNNKGVDHLVARLGSAQLSRHSRNQHRQERRHAHRARPQPTTCRACDKVYAHADYIAVNVSSPNTARLRELQAAGRIASDRRRSLTRRERAAAAPWPSSVPLLVKVAPDLDAEQISALAASLRSLGVDGVIATNTSTDLAVSGAAWPADAARRL